MNDPPPITSPSVVQGVVAVIQDHQHRYLVIKRADSVRAPGCWCFPGGAIEPGETPAEAIVREVMEELRITVRPLAHVWNWRRPDGGLHLQWWTAHWVGGHMTPQEQEVAEVRWLNQVQLWTTARLLPSNRAFLRLSVDL